MNKSNYGKWNLLDKLIMFVIEHFHRYGRTLSEMSGHYQHIQ